MAEFSPQSILGKVSMQENRQENYARHVAKLLVGRLGLPRRDAENIYKGERPITAFYEAWAGLHSGVFPFVVIPRLIASFNFNDIFIRPTRSVVVEEYKIAVEEHAEPRRPVAMMFQADQIGQLVAVPYGIADVPTLAVPPVCMIVHFERWWNRIVGVDREPE